MQVGSATSANIAMEQVARSIQMLNHMTKDLATTAQEFDNKMLNFAVQQKVGSAIGQHVNLQA